MTLTESQEYYRKPWGVGTKRMHLLPKRGIKQSAGARVLEDLCAPANELEFDPF